MALHDQEIGDAAHAAPGDRRLGGEGAPPGDDDDVGSDVLESRHDARRQRIVVMQHARGARNAEAAEEDGSVLRLDAPGASGDGSRRVDDGQVDLGERGDTVEKRSAIRGGLREDGCDPDRRRIRRRGECAEQVGGVAVRALRQRAAPSATRAATCAGKQRIEPRGLAQNDSA